jgi:hypothetical protein
VGTGDTIRGAVEQLLKMKDGFVIFDDGNDDEYVQYSLEKDGLTLMWPAGGPRVPSTDPRVAALLDEHDVRYVVESDGIYGQFGHDVDLVEKFTTAAFEKVYGRFSVAKVNVRLGS